MWIEIKLLIYAQDAYKVTPFAGVWIEIESTGKIKIADPVTPFAGVWIEISDGDALAARGKSLPSRECGLNSCWGVRNIRIRFHAE